MEGYKVPQDVEADDKLIGPFSFRQFMYLIAVAVFLAMAWGLFMLLPPLAIIPLPPAILFGALALPLRKDQPMEIYLAAVISYYTKPRRRVWQPDGIESFIEISAPKIVEEQRTKDLSQSEAEQRFSYLANLVDTHGWSVRGVNGSPQANSPMNTDAYIEAQRQEDVLDESNTVSQNLSHMIEQSDARRHQEMIDRIKQGVATPQPVPTQPYPQQQTAAPQQQFPQQQQTQPAQYTPQNPYANLQPPVTQQPVQSAPNPFLQPAQTQPAAPQQGSPQFNPYPNSMNQSVIQPLSQQYQSNTQAPTQPQTQPAPETAPSTSEKQLSPDIINLANNADLSVETIAREAKRIQEKEAANDQEVVISFR